MVTKIKYGNTNTFFIHGEKNILIDTDYAGTLPMFYKAIKEKGIDIEVKAIEKLIPFEDMDRL